MRNWLDEVTNGFSSPGMTSEWKIPPDRSNPQRCNLGKKRWHPNGPPAVSKLWPPGKMCFSQMWVLNKVFTMFCKGQSNKSGDKLGYVLRISVNWISLDNFGELLYIYNIYNYNTYNIYLDLPFVGKMCAELHQRKTTNLGRICTYLEDPGWSRYLTELSPHFEGFPLLNQSSGRHPVTSACNSLAIIPGDVWLGIPCDSVSVMAP